MQTHDLNTVIGLATRGFKLDIKGIHGLPHWQRVAQRGALLAVDTGANVKVVTLFAYLHDACREDEDEDPGHGLRGAEHASSLAGYGHLPLNDSEVILLLDAIEHHSDGTLSKDPTIGTCWDADRADLWRVGITPAPRFLSTDAAKAMLKREINEQLLGEQS
jgi:uncharacterized protein